MVLHGMDNIDRQLFADYLNQKSLVEETARLLGITSITTFVELDGGRILETVAVDISGEIIAHASISEGSMGTRLDVKVKGF